MKLRYLLMSLVVMAAACSPETASQTSPEVEPSTDQSGDLEFTPLSVQDVLIDGVPLAEGTQVLAERYWGPAELAEALSVPPGGSVVPSDGGVTLQALEMNISSAGRTGGYFFTLPEDFEQAASGQAIVVAIRASSASTSVQLLAAYSTNEVGNSGWKTFDLGATSSQYGFKYDTPPMNAGNLDYLGLAPLGGDVSVSEVLLIAIAR
jgi:hypothetical protein